MAMYLLMRYNGVPRLARQKIGESLVSSMIAEYSRATSAASSHRLASFVGIPPGEVLDHEFERRVRQVYGEIFPDHQQCGTKCSGHQLPLMPMLFLKELGLPDEISLLPVRAKMWFYRMDVDGSGDLDHHELTVEFCRIGLTAEQAEDVLRFHSADGGTSCSYEDLVHMLHHVFENAVPALTAADFVALCHRFVAYDIDGDGKMDLNEFRSLAV